MDLEVRKAFDAVRNFDGKAFRSGCYAPYVSLYFTSLGNVLACCKNETYVLGNVEKNRLKEIWNGNKTQKLRQALKDYRYEAGCEFCEWQISEGNYQGAFPWLFENFQVTSANPEWPSMIEFAGSNTCNFECIMCNGDLSSAIRAHKDGLPPLPRFYSDQFFEDLREFIPHLKRAKFLGGEPFLAAECLRIWDMIIEQEVRLPCHVTTNGSQYNSKVERILEYLPISLTVSIDGRTKETYQKVRLNSNYEEVFENVNRFRRYTRKRKTFFSIAFCLMRQNWHEFIDMLLFAEDLDCEVFVNTVIGPSYCSLFTLPAEELAHIADEIENRGLKVEKKLRRNRKVWQENVIKLRGKSSEGQAKQVRKIIDTHYNKQDHLTIAWNLANSGLKKEALEEARKVQKGEPTYYKAVAYCGNLQRELGDFDGAEMDLQRAIKISAKRPEAFLYLANLRFEESRLDEALENALKAKELIRQEDLLEIEVCKILTAIYLRESNLIEGRNALARWSELQPSSNLAHLYKELNDVGKLNSRPEAFIHLARLCFEQNSLEEALENAFQALRMLNEDERLESEVYEIVVRIHLRKGDVSKAREALDHWLNLTPMKKEDPSIYFQLAYAGNARRETGDFEAAEKELQRAIKICPERPEAFLYLSRLNLERNRLEEALEKALSLTAVLKEKDFILQLQSCELLVRIHVCMGNIAAAHNVMDRWLLLLGAAKDEPDLYWSVAYAGDLQRELGKLEAAEFHLQRAMRISKQQPEAYLYLAKVRLDQNRISEAVELARDARKLIGPDDPMDREIADVLSSISAHSQQRRGEAVINE